MSSQTVHTELNGQRKSLSYTYQELGAMGFQQKGNVVDFSHIHVETFPNTRRHLKKRNGKSVGRAHLR